ncbi:MAG TPA: hypothetical protein VNZ45_05440 [Bacteroidia bacterium]|jgi:hypothetical protein|nr:hypothetical protein [Bacteroidia bacterium]
MKKSFVIIAVLFLATYTVKAQFLDSIRAAIERKGRFTAGFNSRNSFITNYDAPIFGYLIGVCFDRKFAIGGGWNTLTSYRQITETVDGRIINNATLNFSYFSYYVEYLFRVTKHWEINVPISIGIGNSSFTYTLAGITKTANVRTVVPIEPTVEVDYYFNKYWGLSVQVGYRFMLIDNRTINQNFDFPTYSTGILIFPFEIFAGLFPHTKLAHMIEDN